MKRQTVILCGLVVAVALIAITTITAAREQVRMDRLQQFFLAKSIETGAGLYEIHCRTCHGSKGEGVGQMGPAINDKKFFTERPKELAWQDTLEAYIQASIIHGRQMATRPMYAGDGLTAVMSPWLEEYGGPLRRDEINDLTLFVLNWEPTALGKVELIELETPKTNLSDPRIVADGKKVFLANCAACHTVDGVSKGDKKGPELTHIAEIAASRQDGVPAEDYIRESFLIPNAYVVEGYEPETIGYHCGAVLSAGRFDQVVAFLLSLN